MAINSQEILDSKSKKYGASENQRFARECLRAINFAVARLDQDGLAEASLIDSIGEDVVLDAKYEDVLDAGVDFFLQRAGEWSIEDGRDYEKEFTSGLARVQGEYFLDATGNDIHGKLGDPDDF